MPSYDQAPYDVPQNTASAPVDPRGMVQQLGASASSTNLGPVSLGGRYDSQFGLIGEAQYATSLGEEMAAGLLGEYGANHYRLNATVGANLWQDAQVKVTGEYLNQRLPFAFDSGQVEDRVGQHAFGAQLRQNLIDSPFQNIFAGTYWAHAPSKTLSTETFTDGGLSYLNERRLAGSSSFGFNAGGVVLLSPSTRMNGQLFYDDVTYNMLLTNSTARDQSGFGAGLQLEQLVNDYAKLALKTEARTMSDIYGGQFSWAPPFNRNMDIILSAERLVSNNGTPSSSIFGLNFSFALDDGRPRYSFARQLQSDLLSWVKEPAVRMTRVLVEAEQRTTVISPIAQSVTPNTGSVAGSTVVTISGTNFTAPSSVTFGGVAATGITVVNNSTITATLPAHAAGTVDVVISNSAGTTTLIGAYTYALAAPVITSLSIAGSPPAGGATVYISGTNFTNTTAVTFGGTIASFTIYNDTFMEATVPAHALGVVDLVATNTAGSSTQTSNFTYQVPVIFVSTAYDGNLGGPSGADAKCNSDANKPTSSWTNGYTYRALMGGQSTTTPGVTYYRPDGTTVIATATASNLVGAAGTLTNPITNVNGYVWTGYTFGNCLNWTTASNSESGRVGAGQTVDFWWNAGDYPCNTLRTLYCVSQ